MNLPKEFEEYVERGVSLEEIGKKRNLSFDVVANIARRIHSAEYKRRQAPLSLRVSGKAFSKGRHVPVVQQWIK